MKGSFAQGRRAFSMPLTRQDRYLTVACGQQLRSSGHIRTREGTDSQLGVRLLTNAWASAFWCHPALPDPYQFDGANDQPS